MIKEIHECEYVKAVTGDVTYRIRNNKFYCRRCGGELKDSQVENKTLKEVREK